jgi:hypothetical protein
MSADTPTLDKPLPESLARLAELLQDGAHLLTVGDESISQAALLATKEIFDLGGSSRVRFWETSSGVLY